MRVFEELSPRDRARLGMMVVGSVVTLIGLTFLFGWPILLVAVGTAVMLAGLMET